MIKLYKQFDFSRRGGIGRISAREVQFCQNNDNFGIYSDLWANLNQGVLSYGGKLGDGSYILIEAPRPQGGTVRQITALSMSKGFPALCNIIRIGPPVVGSNRLNPVYPARSGTGHVPANNKITYKLTFAQNRALGSNPYS